MKKIVFLLLVLCFLISSIAFAGGKTYTIKFAYVTPELTYYQNYHTNYVTTFKGYVERMSQGRINVEVYPAGQMGGEREALESVQLGTVEMTVLADGTLFGFYKKAMVTSTPGVFASIEEANAVFSGPWGEAWHEELRKALGVKVLNHFSFGFRNFSNNLRTLKTPVDAKDIKFRVMENPLFVKMVESLGAIATPMPSNEMYTALQHGVVDGQENPICAVISDKTFEVQKYYTLDGHTCGNQYVFVNDGFFNSLPNDLQKIVLDGANRAGQSVKGFIYTQEEIGVKFLKEHMEVYTPTSDEAAMWREAVSAKTIDYIRSQIGDEIVDSMLNAIKEYREHNK